MSEEKLGRIYFAKPDETYLRLETTEKWAIAINALSHYYNHYKEKLEKMEEGTDLWLRKKEQMDTTMEMIIELDSKTER